MSIMETVSKFIWYQKFQNSTKIGLPNRHSPKSILFITYFIFLDHPVVLYLGVLMKLYKVWFFIRCFPHVICTFKAKKTDFWKHHLSWTSLAKVTWKNWELTRLIPILSAMPTRIESSLIIGPWQACDSSLPLDLSSAVGISVEFQSLSWLQFYFWSTPHQASDSHRVDFDVRSLLAERKWREQ